jgi:D-glycero-alpha-D-manno-heptose 1-phosphate guanylyltransferase
MKAIILAGGEGKRLRSVINDVPKPMAPINEKPFLEYLILQLRKQNLKDIIISTGYKGSIIKNYFQDGGNWDINIEYSEEDKPLGTGGALRKAGELIDDEQFIVMNGDSFFDIEFKQLISFHEEKQAVATISLAYAETIERYGHVEIGNDGEITKFVEKGNSVSAGHVNGGIYILNSELINKIPLGQVSLETEVLPNLINRGLFGMKFKSFFIDIGKPEEYQRICKEPVLLYSDC